MTFQTKCKIDLWVGGFLLALLFPAVRFLGLIMRRDHTTTRRRGCVTVKLVGAGSLFLAMPALSEIRDRFPPGRFYLVGTPAVTGTARAFGWFDEYWTIDDSSLSRLLITGTRTLWRMATRTDHLIDLEVHSRLTTLLSVLSAVRNRLGFVDEIVLWRRGFYTHMTFFNVHGPVYVFYDLLARWFGVGTVAVSAFHDAFRRRTMAAALPAGILPAAPYVTVGHACSELGRERQILPEEWRRLLRPILLAGHEILFLGGPGDGAAAEAIIAAVGRGRNLCGKLDIVQSAKVIGRGATYYGIDSMLLHFARALGVPSISVFGPTDPATRLRPLGLSERVAFSRLPCSPCIHVNETPPCQGRRTCMARAVEDLIAVPELAQGMVQTAPASVGWDLAPGAVRVREVSVDYA